MEASVKDEPEPSPRPLLVSSLLVSNDLGLTPSLKQLLECPVCKCTSIPPIYLCKQGHTVCHFCKEKLEKCQVCGDEYTTMRNELAESIVGSCVFHCPFVKEGCAKTLRGSQVSQHYAECEFRPIKCNIHNKAGEACGKMVQYSKHVHHMKNDHGLVGVAGSSAVIGMSASIKFGQGNWTFPAHFMNAFGQTFWCNLHASYNILIAWVGMSGTEIELESYAASVTIFDREKKWQQAKWIGGVHSVRSTAKEVYDSGNCLSLLPETFLLLAKVHVDETNRKVKSWRCHFEIIEKEEMKMEPPNTRSQNERPLRSYVIVPEVFEMANATNASALESDFTHLEGSKKLKDKLNEQDKSVKEKSVKFQLDEDESQEPTKEQLQNDDLDEPVKEQFENDDLDEPVKVQLGFDNSDEPVKEQLENDDSEEPVMEDLETE